MSIWTRASESDTRAFERQQLRLAALGARDRQRARAATHRHGPGPTGHRPHKAVEEHYHVIYHLPAENIAIPYFKEVFATVRDAYVKMADLGHRAAPNVEWYEDGEVGFETTMPGRVGLYWVVVEVTGCVRQACAQYMTKEMRKRQFTFVPEPDRADIVISEINPAAVEILGPGSVTDERDL